MTYQFLFKVEHRRSFSVADKSDAVDTVVKLLNKGFKALEEALTLPRIWVVKAPFKPESELLIEVEIESKFPKENEIKEVERQALLLENIANGILKTHKSPLLIKYANQFYITEWELTPEFPPKLHVRTAITIRSCIVIKMNKFSPVREDFSYLIEKLPKVDKVVVSNILMLYGITDELSIESLTQNLYKCVEILRKNRKKLKIKFSKRRLNRLGELLNKPERELSSFGRHAPVNQLQFPVNPEDIKRKLKEEFEELIEDLYQAVKKVAEGG